MSNGRNDDIRARWSFDCNDGYMAGDVTIKPIDWGMASEEGRRRLIRDEVGNAVLRALDVDWSITNARIDDPNY